MDGALQRSHAGGIGLVIRDCQGVLVAAAGWEVSHWDSTQVELLAISYVGRIVCDQMFEAKGVIIEGDNAGVIQYMQNFKQHADWRSRPTEGDKFDWMSLFHKVIFVHTYRRYNRAAPFCAQRAIHSSFFWSLQDRSYDCIPQ